MEEILLISWLNEMFSRESGVNKCISLKVLGTVPLISLSLTV